MGCLARTTAFSASWRKFSRRSRPWIAQAAGRGGGEIGPTFFEILTAAALLHFARAKTDIAVLEVGLGGRLDATNVCRPLVSVIASISFDHQRQLGDTLAAIAGEKAGIVKRGVPWSAARRSTSRGR